MADSLFPRTLETDGKDANPVLRIGRPRRDTVIGTDDLFNLRIALGLHRDVLELCDDPHLFGPGTGAVASRPRDGR